MRGWCVVADGQAEFRDDLIEPTLDREGSSPHDVVVAVEGAAVNFADSLMIAGRYQERPRPPFVPGLEVVGTVIAANGDRFRPGDRVVGLPVPGHGAWAERALCDARQLVAVPSFIDPLDAVAVHINAQTAWFALHERAHVVPTDRVLVHAAAGGVGSMAVQLARAAGVEAIVGTASPDKLATVTALGALAVDNRADDWADVVRQAMSGDRRVDVVVDPVGGAVFDQTWRLLAFDARYVVVGFASGAIPTFAANHILVKNVTVAGLYWTRYTIERPALVAHAAEEIWRLVAAGTLDPMITRRQPMESAVELASAVASGSTTGKCVVSWS